VYEDHTHSFVTYEVLPDGVDTHHHQQQAAHQPLLCQQQREGKHQSLSQQHQGEEEQQGEGEQHPWPKPSWLGPRLFTTSSSQLNQSFVYLDTFQAFDRRTHVGGQLYLGQKMVD